MVDEALEESASGSPGVEDVAFGDEVFEGAWGGAVGGEPIAELELDVGVGWKFF